MFQLIISILAFFVKYMINSKLSFISKLGYFIYELKTDLLIIMFRRKANKDHMWIDADFSYVEGAALYYTTYQDMLKHARENMNADTLFQHTEQLDAPCGCSYTLEVSGTDHDEHDVICAATTQCLEELYPEEEVGKDRLRKTSIKRYEDMNRARQPRDKGHK